MAITSYGYDGTVLEAPWAKLSRFLGREYGVGGDSHWLVTAVTGVDRTVKIALGDGYGRGVLDVSNSDVTLQATTLASGTRWDTVVARRNWSTNTTSFVIVPGTATMALASGLNATPGTLDDQPIALVQITAGQQVPTAVVDLRPPYTEDRSEVGTIKACLTTVAPNGYAIMDGRALNRVKHARLFSLWGTTYGAGDGSTTFNVPNWSDRTVVGFDALVPDFDTLGKQGGSKTHTLTEAEMPAHAHDMGHGHTATTGSTTATHSHDMGHAHPRSYGSTYGGAGAHAHAEYLSDFPTASGGSIRLGYNGGGGNNTGAAGAHDHAAFVDVAHQAQSTGAGGAGHTHTVAVAAHVGNTSSKGSGTAHNNMPPFAVANWIVKAA